MPQHGHRTQDRAFQNSKSEPRKRAQYCTEGRAEDHEEVRTPGNLSVRCEAFAPEDSGQEENRRDDHQAVCRTESRSESQANQSHAPQEETKQRYGTHIYIIHSSAWKGNSANFALTELSEVAPDILRLHNWPR